MGAAVKADERSRRLRAALDDLGLTQRMVRLAGDPPTTYEAVTRQMLESALDEVRELRKLLLALFATVIGAVVVLLLRQVIGLS
jgi:hypothetical protein